MAYEDIHNLHPSANRTTSGNSGAIGLGKSLTVGVMVEVTTQAGTTPTLDFTIEWSMDGTNFAVAQPVDNFTQITTTVPVRAVKSFQVKAPFFRVVWTIGGSASPNYTFSITRFGVGT